MDCGSVNLAFGRDRISNAVLWHSGSVDARPQPIWDLAAGDLGLGAYYVVVSHGVKILHDPDTHGISRPGAGSSRTMRFRITASSP